MYLFGGLLLGGLNEENWGGRSSKFLYKFCGTLICDGPIETVKYIGVNILYMLDQIFTQNCRNSPSLHTAGQLARKAESL